MEFSSTEIKLKTGKTLIIRSAARDDASNLLDYLRTTCDETRFLSSYSDEFGHMTVEYEEKYIENVNRSERDFMLLAMVDGEHAGNVSVSSVGGVERVRHRCSLGIALYAKFCGLGIGEALIREAMEFAKDSGYEIMELEVVADNQRAIALYKKLGFEVYGKRKNAVKYRDGSYADELLMSRSLIFES